MLSVSDGSLKESESELLHETGIGVSHLLVLFGSLWSVSYTSFVTEPFSSLVIKKKKEKKKHTLCFCISEVSFECF